MDPVISKPLSQWKVILVKYVVFSPTVVPFNGTSRGPQSTAWRTKVGRGRTFVFSKQSFESKIKVCNVKDCSRKQHLRLQIASIPLQVPFAWHLLTEEPSFSYPTAQAKVIVWGYLVETPATDPSSGTVGLPQSMAWKWERDDFKSTRMNGRRISFAITANKCVRWILRWLWWRCPREH